MNIELSDRFKKEVKRLSKKYRSFTGDIIELIESLKTNPFQGVPLRKGAFKIRMKITAKRKGKSGGARVISVVFIEEDELYLLTVYDKSERENITDKELDDLINNI